MKKQLPDLTLNELDAVLHQYATALQARIDAKGKSKGIEHNVKKLKAMIDEQIRIRVNKREKETLLYIVQAIETELPDILITSSDTESSERSRESSRETTPREIITFSNLIDYAGIFSVLIEEAMSQTGITENDVRMKYVDLNNKIQQFLENEVKVSTNRDQVIRLKNDVTSKFEKYLDTISVVKPAEEPAKPQRAAPLRNKSDTMPASLSSSEKRDSKKIQLLDPALTKRSQSLSEETKPVPAPRPPTLKSTGKANVKAETASPPMPRHSPPTLRKGSRPIPAERSSQAKVTDPVKIDMICNDGRQKAAAAYTVKPNIDGVLEINFSRDQATSGLNILSSAMKGWENNRNSKTDLDSKLAVVLDFAVNYYDDKDVFTNIQLILALRDWYSEIQHSAVLSPQDTKDEKEELNALITDAIDKIGDIIQSKFTAALSNPEYKDVVEKVIQSKFYQHYKQQHESQKAPKDSPTSESPRDNTPHARGYDPAIFRSPKTNRSPTRMPQDAHLDSAGKTSPGKGRGRGGGEQ